MKAPAIDAPESALLAMKIAQRVGSQHPFRLGSDLETHRSQLAKLATIEGTLLKLEQLAQRIDDGVAGLTKRVVRIEAARGIRK